MATRVICNSSSENQVLRISALALPLLYLMREEEEMTVVITMHSLSLSKALLKRIGVAADGRCRCCGSELSFWRMIRQEQFCCWDHRKRWRVKQLSRVLGMEGAATGF